jgi:hypothetical protein
MSMNFNWTSNEEQDDFACEVNNHLLRAEQMEHEVWWWCIYNPKGEQVLSSYTNGEWCDNAEQAILKAQEGFLSLQETKDKVND